MAWWLRVSSLFSPLSTEACEKSSQLFWKDSCVNTGVRKPRSTCTLAVKVALKPNITIGKGFYPLQHNADFGQHLEKKKKKNENIVRKGENACN